MSAPRPEWAADSTVHTHDMAPWWARVHPRARAARIRQVGNVAFLPSPIAGYRLRHHAGGVSVEIEPRRAPAIEIARCAGVEAARAVLATMSASDARPLLGEVHA